MAFASNSGREHDAAGIEASPFLGRRPLSPPRSPRTRDEGHARDPLSPPPASWPFLALLVGVIIFVSDLGSYLAQAPLVRLFESIRCLEFYQVNDPSVITIPQGGGAPFVPEALCKVDPVQDTIATVIGWQQLWDALPGVLLGVAYGALADRTGRRRVLFVAVLGCEMAALWIAFVCYFGLSLYLTWLSSAFLIFGGGPFTATAMLFVMIADVVPSTKRTAVFLFLHSAMIIGNMIGPALSSVLMQRSPWPPVLIGAAVQGSALLVILLLPETKNLRGKPSSSSLRSADDSDDYGDSDDSDDGEGAGLLAGAEHLDADEPAPRAPQSRNKKNLKKERPRTARAIIVSQIVKVRAATSVLTRSATLAVLVLTSMLVTAGVQSMIVFLQYVSRKFGWTLARAALLNSLRSAVELSVSIAILPCISYLLVRRRGMSAPHADLWVARGTAVSVAAGFLLIGVADAPGVLILGLILSTTAGGLAAAVRSVATSLVGGRRSPDTGKLYSLLGILGALGGLLAGPPLAAVFKWGMHRGRRWIGLPFMITGGLYVLSAVGTMLVRLPNKLKEETEEDEGEGEGLGRHDS